MHGSKEKWTNSRIPEITDDFLCSGTTWIVWEQICSCFYNSGFFHTKPAESTETGKKRNAQGHILVGAFLSLHVQNWDGTNYKLSFFRGNEESNVAMKVQHVSLGI